MTTKMTVEANSIMKKLLMTICLLALTMNAYALNVDQVMTASFDSSASPTISDAGNFALSAGWTGSVDETLTLYIQADNDYIELARSTN